MKLNFRSEKGKLTEAMKQYAEEKTSKLTKYIKDQEELKGNLVWKINGPKQVVEITIPLKGFVLRVEESGEDFYSIIDLSIDKLERQIRKNKTRIEKQINKTKIDFDYFEEIEDEEENKGIIVKRKTMELKPMDEEEAILQMELLGHDFYLFKNTENNKVTMVYKRKNNDYGLIEEE